MEVARDVIVIVLGIPYIVGGLIPRLWKSFQTIVLEAILFQTFGENITSTIVSVVEHNNTKNVNNVGTGHQQQHRRWLQQQDNNNNSSSLYKIVVMYTVRDDDGNNNKTTRIIKEFHQARVNNTSRHPDYVVGQELRIRYLPFWPKQAILPYQGDDPQCLWIWSDPWSALAGFLVVLYLDIILSVFVMTRVSHLPGILLSSNIDESSMADFVWSNVIPALGIGFGRMIFSALVMSWLWCS